ncbi:hypothetical protein ACFFKU_17940 [Kineococcus gynurae]|uniref:Uncharacterized protein n=1 Tax=Kineococcus gynurae TaxID=452979 RepID=A0ABV5LNJ2_9ACTN
MSSALVLALVAATSTPVPTRQETPPADLVSPGIGGFLALFLLALAVYFLGRSMARRVRRVNQRAQVEAEAAAAQQESETPRQD